MSVLFFFCFIFTTSTALETYNYDMNGKHVTYYPESLMLSYNPEAVVFYDNTYLFNFNINMRSPALGKNFAINNTCSKENSKFLTELLAQLRTVQRSMLRILSSHGYTSLIECDSYIRRYYQYATGLTSTMTCPYEYKKSLTLCKRWALQYCHNISPQERTWLLNSNRAKRSLNWACTAGLGNIPRYLYLAFGGSCESDGFSQLLIPLLFNFASTFDTMHSMTKILQGKTVYLAKITDKLVTKVNNLQSSLRYIDKVFLAWQGKLTQFADHENCHFNNFMEFLSKFSLEVTRAFSTLLRLLEIKDILHQAQKLHAKESVGLQDLPAFVSSELQLRLKQLPHLQSTSAALDSGFSLLLQPLVDFSYDQTKNITANILFTVPQLSTQSAFCTLEHLASLKYKQSDHCYHGPIIRDALALLHCANNDYLLHKTDLDKCSHSDHTFVCPRSILTLVNDTKWLGLPWHPQIKLVFSRRHQRAIDCTSLSDFLHLGGRYYLSLQRQNLTFHNRTDNSLQELPLTPLTIYHLPCDLVFATQPIGFGECPLRLSFHLPIFTQTQFHYIPWDNSHDNSTLTLHYQSLNFTPLHFDNTTLQSLDHTFQLLDGKFVTQLTTLRRQISRLHPVTKTRLNDFRTYVAFPLAILNTIFLICLRCSSPNRQSSSFVSHLISRSSNQTSLKTRRARGKQKDVGVVPLESLSAPHDIDSSAVIEQSTVVPPSCSKCCKPISFANTEPAAV